MESQARVRLLDRIEDGSAVVGIIGLGYVGLPLAAEMSGSGYRVIGFDVQALVVAGLMAGRSHVRDVPADVLADRLASGRFQATTDFGRLSECDAIAICVPTPLSKTKDPDLSFVAAATESVRASLRPGQLIVLESTTYPGTTRDFLLPVLEQTGLQAGQDFFLCYSPERVDPGNPVWQTRNTPKVMGGVTAACTDVGVALYSRVFDTVVPVEDVETAELVKVYENTFRMINIALVNELAQVCERLGVDVWSVVDAAATKPFGFMKFSPGPGLGGHCIPLDPHYLSWKMRTLAFKTRMIELASEVNAEMPAFVVRKVIDALNDDGRATRGSRVLVMGVAYKKDVSDLRESPALEIMRLLQEKGAEVVYHDPLCPEIADDGHTMLRGLPMRSVPFTDAELHAADAIVIVADHCSIDWASVAANARIVIDTRGVLRGKPAAARVVGLSTPAAATGPILQAAG
ncbi:MAG: nucleotide sugar dehydrogenase [Longimicrobiales bacterium]